MPKTNETVFGQHSPKRLQLYPSVDGIELVDHAKLLGVIILDNSSVNLHVNYVL